MRLIKLNDKISPPVKVGEVVELEVLGFGDKGNAFGKVENFVIFINDVSGGLKAGDVCCVKVSKVLRTVGFGDRVMEEE